MGAGIALRPTGEAFVLFERSSQFGGIGRQRLIRRVSEEAGVMSDVLVTQGGRAALDMQPFVLDLGGKALHRHRLDQNLDARLVLVVATAKAVVNPQHRVQIGQQVRRGQKILDHVADDGGTPQTAAHHHSEAHFAGLVAHHVQADVVHAGGCAVFHAAGHRDLEFARQEGELGVQGAPLPNDFAPGPRVQQFVAGHAGEGVGRRVAHAVARSLDRMHLHRGQLFQDIGHPRQLRPVELNVLAGGEMAVALIVAAGDVGQLAQLAAAQMAVGNGDAQHRRVALHVQAVHQTQRAKLVLAQLAGQIAPGLIAELDHALADDAVIDFIILIHGALSDGAMPDVSTGWP